MNITITPEEIRDFALGADIFRPETPDGSKHCDTHKIAQNKGQWKSLIKYLKGEIHKNEYEHPDWIDVTLERIYHNQWKKQSYLCIFNPLATHYRWVVKDPTALAKAIEAYLDTVDDNGNSINFEAPPKEPQDADQNQPIEADDAVQGQHQDPHAHVVPDAHEVRSTLPRNLILQGPPGTGKTHLSRQLAHWLIKGGANQHPIPTIDAAIKQIKSRGTDKDQVNAVLDVSKQFKMVQFHPATSYEDFVRGIRAKTKENSVTYEVEHGHLSEMCEEAAANPTKNYVLLIDEINRANLPAVLGECIFALEYRGQAVDTAYEIEGSKKLTIPENLWIIGTMNTADRSVGHLDYAIRRRFLFVDCLGDASKIADQNAKAKFEAINDIIKEYRSEEFEEKDIQIGHTYFMEADWGTRLQYQVKPILEEYLRDGVLKPSAKEAVTAL